MSVTTQLWIGLVPLLVLAFAVAVRPMPTPRGGSNHGTG